MNNESESIQEKVKKKNSKNILITMYEHSSNVNTIECKQGNREQRHKKKSICIEINNYKTNN